MIVNLGSKMINLIKLTVCACMIHYCCAYMYSERHHNRHIWLVVSVCGVALLLTQLSL